MVRSSRVKKFGHKASHYLSELNLCFQTGADLKSRLSFSSRQRDGAQARKRRPASKAPSVPPRLGRALTPLRDLRVA